MSIWRSAHLRYWSLGLVSIPSFPAILRALRTRLMISSRS